MLGKISGWSSQPKFSSHSKQNSLKWFMINRWKEKGVSSSCTTVAVMYTLSYLWELSNPDNSHMCLLLIYEIHLWATLHFNPCANTHKSNLSGASVITTAVTEVYLTVHTAIVIRIKGCRIFPVCRVMWPSDLWSTATVNHVELKHKVIVIRYANTWADQCI